MRHRHLALVACLAVTGPVAHAAPTRAAKKVAKHKAKAAPPVEQPEEPEDSDAPTGVARLAGMAHPQDRVAVAPAADDPVDDAVELDAPVKLHALAAPPGAKDWRVEIGPYLWASAVDANVSLGTANVGSGVDFLQLSHHAKYGAEVLGEARVGRFTLAGDVMYGVVGIDGGTMLGPLAVTLNGEASSLLVDGAAGYLLVGGDHARLSVEARAGVRYQRTTVAGSLGIAGGAVTPPQQIDGGADALAAGRVVVRPLDRLAFSSNFDIGVFGASSSTWSVSADASVQVTAHLLLSLGWRTLTLDRAHVDIVMHGPRAAVQLTF